MSDPKGAPALLSTLPSAKMLLGDKVALRQSVMQPGERKSVWELLQALQKSKVQSRELMRADLSSARQAEIVREIEIER
jgi:hypothetical protein